MFETLNHTLFAMINAPESTGPQAIGLAKFMAKDLLYLLALGMLLGWLRGTETTRRALFYGGMAALIGLATNQIIHQLWPHPRPFAAGVGTQFLEHVTDTSFPSDHGTIMFSVACALLLSRGGGKLGAVAMLAALATAWARVFLGVHWPMDMAGAFGVSLVSALLVTRIFPRLSEAAFTAALLVYRWILARLHLPIGMFPR